MGKKKTPALKKLGVCIKEKDGTVEYQNQLCVRLCGHQIGKKCAKGCMSRYSQTAPNRLLGQGFRIFRNVDVDAKVVDAVLINDGEKLTTVLYDRSELIQKQLAVLKSFKLSRAETSIVEQYLLGFSNAEIADKLFIGRATLRTHLNNIYKKLPSDLKAEILQSHLGTELKKPKTRRS